MVRILCYHSVNPERWDATLQRLILTPDQLDAQLRTFRKAGYHFVEGQDAIKYLRGEKSLRSRAILLTFDDGYADFLEHALPVLQHHDAPSVLFVVSRLLGGRNEWDVQRGATPGRLLSLEELHRLREAGVAIGAHTRTHPSLPHIPPSEVRGETIGSLEDLEEFGLEPLRVFAYPYGRMTPEVRNLLSEHDILGLSLRPGLGRPNHDLTAIPRTLILSDRSLTQIHIDVLTMNRRPLWWRTARAGLKRAKAVVAGSR